MLVIKEHDVTPSVTFGADMADVDVIACLGSALSAPVPAAPHVDVCVCSTLATIQVHIFGSFHRNTDRPPLLQPPPRAC